jgi:hypothetical protein
VRSGLSGEPAEDDLEALAYHRHVGPERTDVGGWVDGHRTRYDCLDDATGRTDSRTAATA